MNRSFVRATIRCSIFMGATLTVALFTLPGFAQVTFETDSTNTTDNLLWASTINWDQAGAPGSNSTGGSATDNVILSHHEVAAGQQIYRIDSDAGEINNFDINGGTSTGNGGAGDAIQFQIRNGAALTVNGTTTLGQNELASILLNQGMASSLALLGDINIDPGATGQGLNSFINYTSESAALTIGGDINGQIQTAAGNVNTPNPGDVNGPVFGGIDLRLNSGTQTIFNTTGGTVSDTTLQTFNVDDFGVGNSGDNDEAVQTLGQGKIVNAEDLRVGENTNGNNTLDRVVSGDLTIDNTTVNVADDALIGRVANGAGGATIDRSGEGIVTLDNAATLNVGDNLLLGDGAATALPGQFATGTLNIDGASTVAVTDDIFLGATDFAEGTINVNNGTLTTEVGNINIGGNFSNSADDVNSEGTLNVLAAGNVTVGDGTFEQNIFIGRDGMGTVSSAGNVTVTNGDVRLGDSTIATGETNTLNVTDGTFFVSDQVIAGFTAGNTGTINVSGGLLQTGEEIYLAGDNTAGVDDGTMGTLNITGGRVLVNDGSFTTNQNLEVGRDGDGFLNVDGATSILDIHTGNLVVGQSNTVSNNSRGTVNFTDGATINIGDTFVDGANTDGLLNSFNINGGGGDIIQSGAGTNVNIEQNLQLGQSLVVAAVDPASSYTISDTSILNIGNDFAARNGDNSFTVVGDTTDINVGNNLNLNANTLLEFDFTGTSDYDFGFDVDGNVNYNGADLLLSSDTLGLDLTTFDGDILLLDVVGASNGMFANAAAGSIFGAYQLVYDYNSTGFAGGQALGDVGGGTSLALVQAVPEPGSLALLGLCVLGMAARRRRS